MYKVILDTDIGDDIDDAFALGLVLKNNNLDLKMVTTVFKNTIARAKQAKQLVDIEGYNCPIYSGEVYPLNGVITGFAMDQGDLATILPCQYGEEMNDLSIGSDAVNKIIELADEYNGELIVIAIGPLTNIARAIQLDQTLKTKIKAIYSMGGWFTNYAPEWNIVCDPEAADVVYSSGIQVYAVGLDVTLQCPLEGNLLTNLRENSNVLTQTIFKWFDRWMNYFHFEKSVLHDPLAVASLIDSRVCTFEKKYVKVQLTGEKRAAIQVSDTYLDGYSLINVATKVDKEKFFEIIKNTFA